MCEAATVFLSPPTIKQSHIRLSAKKVSPSLSSCKVVAELIDQCKAGRISASQNAKSILAMSGCWPCEKQMILAGKEMVSACSVLAHGGAALLTTSGKLMMGARLQYTELGH